MTRKRYLDVCGVHTSLFRDGRIKRREARVTIVRMAPVAEIREAFVRRPQWNEGTRLAGASVGVEVRSREENGGVGGVRARDCPRGVRGGGQ